MHVAPGAGCGVSVGVNAHACVCVFIQRGCVMAELLIYYFLSQERAGRCSLKYSHIWGIDVCFHYRIIMHP